MQYFIESLEYYGIKVNILDQEYTTIGCANYVLRDKPTEGYTKVYFNDNYLLIISISDNFVAFGQDIGTINEGNVFNKNFI